jgi:hypothetical protein
MMPEARLDDGFVGTRCKLVGTAGFQQDANWLCTRAGRLPTEHVHQPWSGPDGPPRGYPEPIVKHAVERKDALDRYAVVRGR